MFESQEIPDERPSKRRRSISKNSPAEVQFERSYYRREDRNSTGTKQPDKYADKYKLRRRSQERQRHRKSESPITADEGLRRRERRHRNRSRSRSRSQSRSRSRSRSPRRRSYRYDDDRKESKRRRRYSGRSKSPEAFQRSKKSLLSQQDAFKSVSNPGQEVGRVTEKQKPNFGLTGKLAAASNAIQTANQTIILKYHEPPEARKPSVREAWRLYVFKGDDIIETVDIGEQSCWLFGRESAVADFPIENPSCSKQHAVVQFRYIEKRDEFGDRTGRVKPYIIDLESANGTSVNGEQVPPAKYVELRDKDVIQFGHSNREYVIQLSPKE